MRGGALVCGLWAVVLAAGCAEEARPSIVDVVDAGIGADAADEPDAGAAFLVEYVDPDHGPFAGGTEVLLRGRGFAEGMVVRIGGRQVEPLDLEVVDTRRAILRTPPGLPGPADVEIEAAGRTASASDAYRYEQIVVEPASGSAAGGTYVRLRGLGTMFTAGDVVTFDGAPMTGVVRINDQELAGFTPPGVGGAADVVVSGPGGVIEAPGAYTYEAATNAGSGGLGGGAIMDTLTVTVVDRVSRDGLPGAFVTVGDPATSTLQGTTDGFGRIVFAAPGLRGPVDVVAAKDGYERGGFMVADARNVTIWLLPLPDPMPGGGPFPPGRLSGRIRGEIVFGDVTGLGEPTWDLVPEPRTPTERKQARVFTTTTTPFSGAPAPGPGGTVDYVGDGRISWAFDIVARPAAQAVVAVAGLYDEAADPDGDGPQPPGVFTPFAMGITRGLLVGPDEIVDDVTIVVDLPLDAAMQVELVAPPPLGAEGGPESYQARVYLDLGGEGVVRLPGSSRRFAPGATSLLVPALAPLTGAVGDGSYTLITGAYTGEGGAPFSVRVVRGLDDLAVPVVVDGFLGVPRATDPAPGLLATASHLAWAPEGATTGVPVFSYHAIGTAADGFPVWRLFARGGARDLLLPDLVTAAGLAPTPSEELFWQIYEIAIPGLTFDRVNYGHINVNLWSAYSSSSAVVLLPPR